MISEIDFFYLLQTMLISTIPIINNQVIALSSIAIYLSTSSKYLENFILLETYIIIEVTTLPYYSISCNNTYWEKIRMGQNNKRGIRVHLPIYVCKFYIESALAFIASRSGFLYPPYNIGRGKKCSFCCIWLSVVKWAQTIPRLQEIEDPEMKSWK